MAARGRPLCSLLRADIIMTKTRLTTSIVLFTLIAVTTTQTPNATEINITCTWENTDNSSIPGTCVPFQQCPLVRVLYSYKANNSIKSMFCSFFEATVLVCCPKDIYRIENGTIIFVDENNSTVQTSIITADNIEESAPSTLQRKEIINETSETLVLIESDLLPNTTICGMPSLSSRIYGGDIADLNEFPWIARLKYQVKDRILFACGGTLINHRYVLTAAHCLKITHKLLGVRLGEWDSETNTDCFENECNDPHLDVNIEKQIIYPNYTSSNIIHGDIALLRLQQSVNYTDFIKPICLPMSVYVRSHDYLPENNYIAAGWGRSEQGIETTVLRKVELKAVKMDICQVAYRLMNSTDTPNIICAGGSKGQDTCLGDSGGPLSMQIREENSSNVYIMGVTSYGPRRCGQEGIPGIYMRITSFTNWIISVMEP